jgi:hypothetical protein
MLSIVKPVRRMVLTAGLLTLSAVTAFAQAPQIAVPAPGGNPGYPGNQGGFEGCYRVNQNLYGPYRMSFCLNRNGGGSYQVTGGGLNCNGRLSWRDWAGDARIRLQYSWCGRATGWTADTLVCSMERTQWPPYQPGPVWPFNQPQGGQWNQPQIAVPVPAPQPTAGNLRCSYYPAVRGYQPISVTAQRTYY